MTELAIMDFCSTRAHILPRPADCHDDVFCLDDPTKAEAFSHGTNF